MGWDDACFVWGVRWRQGEDELGLQQTRRLCPHALGSRPGSPLMWCVISASCLDSQLVKETAKIWDTKDVKIMATCVRVPVMRAHAESIICEFEKDITEAEALDALSKFPGVSIIDDRKNNRFPTPLDATNQDNVFVGRVRRDISQDGKKSLAFFVCGDQIKKGAALNAVQIAELLIKQ